MKAVVFVLMVFSLSSCTRADIELAGGEFTNSSHWKGRWLLINYWAEWCAPCRAEIPELNELHTQRVQKGVVVLGVNYDGLTGDKLTSLMQTMGITFPVLAIDPNVRYGYDLPVVLPTTVVVDPDGKVVATLTGPQTAVTLLAAIGAQAADPQAH